MCALHLQTLPRLTEGNTAGDLEPVDSPEMQPELAVPAEAGSAGTAFVTAEFLPGHDAGFAVLWPLCVRSDESSKDGL
ncbi:hypothetical protein RRF57_010270 [Xylaria bambusicola]|uniref:Uncharacterized protein n=1 Tax=Xylaria bambusicola TaxID=326684 RepID=A0AAN7US66_9PEZI